MTSVLVVEDDADLAATVRLMLEMEGYRVETTVNGAAPALAATLRPAVVLLDIQMPGMDGIEVARRLRADERTRRIPIVLMSAAYRLRERADEAEVDSLLSKPFDLDEMLALVAHLAAPND